MAARLATYGVDFGSSYRAGSRPGRGLLPAPGAGAADEIGFDLAFRAPADEVELHMHARCGLAWEQARSRILS
jgi:hypothetical protein